MRLSKKGEYAVRALVEIGFESHLRPKNLIQISTVAQRTNIPEKFLEQILLALRNGGVLKSKRGVEGGYSLAKVPDEITPVSYTHLDVYKRQLLVYLNSLLKSLPASPA